MTATITGDINLITGGALSQATLIFELSAYDYDDSNVYAPQRYETQTDSNGQFSVALWVNEDGVRGATYNLLIPATNTTIPFTIPAGTTTADIITLITTDQIDASAVSLAALVQTTLDAFTTVTEVNGTDIVFVKQGSTWVKMTYADFTDGLGGGGGSLPSSTDGQILVSNAGTYASVTMSGHATIDDTGAVTVAIAAAQVSDFNTAAVSAVGGSKNDSGSGTSDLWSASKITTALSGKSDTGHTHTASEVTDFGTAWASALAATDTDSLTEGATNKYYADALVTTYIKALTAKATIVAGDKLLMMDSESSDAPKHATTATLATYMQSALAATFAASSHTHAAGDIVGAVSNRVLVDNGSTGEWSGTPTFSTLTLTGSTGLQLPSLGRLGLNTSSAPGSGFVGFEFADNATKFYPRSTSNKGFAFGTDGTNTIGSTGALALQAGYNYLKIQSGGGFLFHHYNLGYLHAFMPNGLGINTTAPQVPLHVVKASAVGGIVTLSKWDGQGTDASGHGQRQLFTLINGASAEKNVGALDWVWTNSAAGTERGLLKIMAGSAGTLAEVMQGGYNASGNMTWGVFGDTSTQAAAITAVDGNTPNCGDATTDAIIANLQTIAGEVKTLLAAYGLTA